MDMNQVEQVGAVVWGHCADDVDVAKCDEHWLPDVRGIYVSDAVLDSEFDL